MVARKGSRTLENPADFAAKSWKVAILEADNHASKCHRCCKRRFDHTLAVRLGSLGDPKLEAYRLCRKARELYAAERAALAAYRAAGGTLPVEKRR